MKLHTPEMGPAPKPAEYYAKIADAARGAGITVKEDEYERIDWMIEMQQLNVITEPFAAIIRAANPGRLTERV